jgi:hypothetical protein
MRVNEENETEEERRREENVLQPIPIIVVAI